ncbi:serine hydrolase domain-containing protein [Sphingomonas japonica]|uniref:CubicO group peptidase (Beta-lactamase class C family) n=1 Tax=Sphingomonas japonica TaxID=511662 RepID=A0ABX0U3N5_9SPHN|nr:serine hydrolase domain-containing protein [Sphingomonas japonica]NIJ23387.1 CubicO group peptidase (beta-lactamase class C family) [Sphingomonas japonica]
MLRTLSTILLAMLAVPALAQSPGSDISADRLAIARLDGFAQGLTAADRFSGVVLVAQGDRILLERGYGPIDPRDDRDDPAMITPDTRFNLASAGKMFTSTAILQLIAGGKLSLDTRVGEVLPNYRNRDFREKVTIRQLLTHTAGAGDIDLFGPENATNRAAARSHAAMVALHDDRAPAFEPGSNQEYGNFGFVVLGRIVELVSGEPYEAYLARHIFAPAGMTRTGFADCSDPAADIAVGYASVAGKPVRNCETIPARGFGAGGQVSTARDMFAFVQALRSGKLIPPGLFAQATRTYREFMGLGFFATGYGEGVPAREFRWGHGGGADGINTDIRHYPSTGRTVIVLANRDAPVAHEIANFELAQQGASD